MKNLANNTRPVTTLFMLTSLDGKISTGDTEDLDMDRDFPTIDGLKEGLHQYYAVEKTTDLWSFCTGRVQKKMGVNEKAYPAKSPVSFVLLDNNHLTEHGVRYFCSLAQTFVLITQNPEHPGFGVKSDNFKIIYQESLDLPDAMRQLKYDFNCDRLTLQSGGSVNCILLRNKLVDYIDIVIAPVLIGGKKTPTLVDGDSIHSVDELSNLGVLQLQACEAMENSYLRLRYKVLS